jgi:hypothetical protein
MMRKVLQPICSVVIALVFMSGLLSAQDQSAKVKHATVKRVPVSVVLTPSFQYPGNVVILRRPESTPSDLIVMRTESATPEVLSEAVRDLQDIRRADGDFPQTAALLRSRSNGSKERKKPLAWSARVLKDLHAKPVQGFGGFTNAQVVQIWLPRTKKAN